MRTINARTVAATVLAFTAVVLFASDAQAAIQISSDKTSYTAGDAALFTVRLVPDGPQEDGRYRRSVLQASFPDAKTPVLLRQTGDRHYELRTSPEDLPGEKTLTVSLYDRDQYALLQRLQQRSQVLQARIERVNGRLQVTSNPARRRALLAERKRLLRQLRQTDIRLAGITPWSRAAATLLWAPLSPPGVDVTGVWRGTLLIGSTPRMFTFQLHQRSGGAVSGYVLGGTSFRTVTDGGVDGSTLTVTVELVDPQLTRTFHLFGTVSGNTYVASTDDGQGSGTQTVVLTRVPGLFQERQYLVARGTTAHAESLTSLAVVLDSAGGFVSGGFVGQQDCALFACGGGLTSFTENPATGELAVGVEAGGACPGAGSFTAAFDAPTKLYSGTYTFTNCSGTDAGSLMGAQGPRTHSGDVAEVLVAFGRLADDIEAGVSLVGSHPSFSPTYLHYGASLADRLAELNAQIADYDPLQVSFNRFRSLSTVDNPDVHPFLAVPIGVDFHDTRVGTPLGGGAPVTYRDVDSDILHDELKHLIHEAGAWRIRGNQISAPFGMELPFHPADLRYRTYGIWPYGVHAGGHPEGHPGLDFDLAAGADILAGGDGTVASVEDGTTFPGQKVVAIQSGAFLLQYDHMEAATLPPGITVGAAVTRGQVVGHPGKPCCDESLCGGAGCCASYPTATTCAALRPDFNMIHFAVRSGTSALCPYVALSTSAQASLDALFRDALYRGELTEPFLCNSDNRHADVFPFITRWDKTGLVSPANPAGVRFSRPSPDGDEAYEWLDAAAVVVASGTVSVNQFTAPHAIDFHQTSPGVATYYGYFEVEGHADTAVLRLDVGGTTPASRPVDLTGADAYAPTVEQ